MKTCGIDIGSRTIKVLVYDSESAKVLGYKIDETGVDPVQRSQILFHELLHDLKLVPADLGNTVATGYGRKSFSRAAKAVTEITCHARGTIFLFPKARSVIDVGGQDSKVIVLDKKGMVQDFAMNDRCAAGTGRFLEMTADMLKIPLDALSRLALHARKSVEISSMCTVFAESEIVGLLSKGCPREDIVRGAVESVSKRIAAMVDRIGVSRETVFTGGVAKNEAMVRSLENDLNIQLVVPDEPRLTAALGAALIAVEKSIKKRGSSDRTKRKSKMG